MKFRIEMIEDEYDCETCGWSIAHGGRVVVEDDKVAYEVEPVAHCYNSVEASEFDLLKGALTALGHEIEVVWLGSEDPFTKRLYEPWYGNPKDMREEDLKFFNLEKTDGTSSSVR